MYKIQFGFGISKMVGPKKEDFWPKINILKEKKYKIPMMNDSSSKSVQIVLL